MKSLSRNKQAIYYALYAGKTEEYDENGDFTGEYTTSYSSPVELLINVSPARGSADVDIFGINESYTKTMLTSDMNCPIDITSRLWIGIPPTEPYNYVVTKVARSLNSIMYAIKEVTVS